MGLQGFFPLQPLNCVLHKLTGVAERHLFFDVFAVRLDSLYAQAQLLSDAPSPMTLTDQSKDFQFAVAEPIDGKFLRCTRRADELLQHLVGHPLTEIDFSAQDSAQREQHVLGGFLFHDEAAGAGP